MTQPGEAFEREMSLQAIRQLVDEQAEDEALWAANLDGTVPISEAYLQQELRRLHALIEAEISPGEQGDGPCARCGGPANFGLGRHTYWFADNALWNEIVPNRVGVLCPRCFVSLCAERRIGVGWRVGRVGEIEQSSGEQVREDRGTTAQRFACRRCGGLPPGECSGAADLCTCILDLEASLATLADHHHRTLTNSRLHDPEHIEDFRECPAKSCQAAHAALSATSPVEGRAIAAWKRVEKERRAAMAQRRKRRGVEAILAELVRLKDLKESNPAAYAAQAEAKRHAWHHARRVLAEGHDEGPRIAIPTPRDLETARELAQEIPAPQPPLKPTDAQVERADEERPSTGEDLRSVLSWVREVGMNGPKDQRPLSVPSEVGVAVMRLEDWSKYTAARTEEKP